MDKDSRSSSSSLPGNGVMAVLMLVAGVMLMREAPLETTRLPVNEARLSQQHDLQDVDARLWQDPYAAVAKARAEAAKRGQDSAARFDADRTQQLADEIEKKTLLAPGKLAAQVEVLAVMLPAGPYSENVESRRRARYAVLAALNAGRMSPVDTEHLGYFLPKEGFSPANKSPSPIPYEWFEPMSDPSPRTLVKGLQSHVLVMWLQSETFDTDPFARMALLVGSLPQTRVTWRVLGPNGSDGLRSMVDETMPDDYKAPQILEHTRFYSLYATVPEKILFGNRSAKGTSQDLSKYFADKGLHLVRTIGNDARLADALTDELALRGLEPRPLELEAGGQALKTYSDVCTPNGETDPSSPSRIAVVAEWDTLYGRSLRRQFMTQPDDPGFCVDRYIYVRGLDGQMPASGDGAPAAAGAKQQPDDKDAQRRKDGTFVEIAEGQSQFDYLRRLAVQMREKDERLRRNGGSGHGYRAIGVLGNDVHDKLLVLQALRPEFPNAIFFTTDMDARFLHPREQAWTRNLIVASSFGLRLTDSLQGGAPPFRDGYQTSAFLSTRLALDDARRASPAAGIEAENGKAKPTSQDVIASWLAKPRVFEIGRTGAFDFSGRPYRVLPASNNKGGRYRVGDWTDSVDVHPEGTPLYPSPEKVIMFLVFSAMLLALWVPFFALHLEFRRPALRTLDKYLGTPATRLRAGGWVLLVVMLQFGLPLWLAFQWEDMAGWLTQNGKPLTVLEGISLWPTELIRLFTLVLCVYLVFRCWMVLSQNLDEISQEFGSGRACDVMAKAQEMADRHMPLRHRLLQMFSTGIVPPASASPRQDVNVAKLGLQPAAVDFWSQHVVQSRLSARLVRTTACVVIAAIVSLLLVWAIGEFRFVPARGRLSEAVHEGLRMPALLMMYFLIFFVVDAIVLSVRFVRGLLRLRREKEKGGEGTNWPEVTLEKFRSELDLPKGYVGNWIDLKFIALRTRAVTGLIYYPFIVISLWLLSKSAVFDHWTLSVGSLGPP